MAYNLQHVHVKFTTIERLHVVRYKFCVFSLCLLHGLREKKCSKSFHVFLTSKNARISNETKINASVMEVFLKFLLKHGRKIHRKCKKLRSRERKFIAPDSRESTNATLQTEESFFRINATTKFSFLS